MFYRISNFIIIYIKYIYLGTYSPWFFKNFKELSMTQRTLIIKKINF